MAQYRTTFNGLNYLLGTLPSNTPASPHDILITEITKEQCTNNSMSSSSNTLKYVLTNNSDKYVKLTFTNIPSNLTNASYMFYGCTSLVSIDVGNFDPVSDATGMFRGCTNLTSAVNNYGFYGVLTATEMFYGCTSLNNFDAYGFEYVTNAERMFKGCTAFVNVDTFGFANITNANEMYASCTSMRNIEIYNFDKVYYANSMFENCTSLEEIDISSLKSINSANSMFKNCTSLKSIDMKLQNSISHGTEMFSGCTQLRTITNWNLSINNFSPDTVVENFWGMFDSTNLLDRIYLVPIPARYKGEILPNRGDVEEAINDKLLYSNIIIEQDIPIQISTSFTYFDRLLKTLPANTGTSPFNIDITSITSSQCTNNSDSETSGNIKYVLHQNPSKYVSLSFSGLPSNLTKTDYMFDDCKRLVSLDTKAFSRITSARYMFRSCMALKSIDVSGFTSLKDSQNLFSGCYSLETIDNWIFNTDELIATDMFKGCENLNTINVPLPQNTSITPALVKISKTSNALNIKRIPIDTSKPTVNATTSIVSSVGVFGNTDELLIADSISDELVAKMLQYRYRWSSSNTVLDPTMRNFVLWAGSDSNVVQNLIDVPDMSGKLDVSGSNGTATGVSALINKLSTGTSDPTDNDYYVSQYAGGGTTTTTYHRRPLSALWNWIKGKLTSVFGYSDSGYGRYNQTMKTDGTGWYGNSYPVYWKWQAEGGLVKANSDGYKTVSDSAVFVRNTSDSIGTGSVTGGIGIVLPSGAWNNCMISFWVDVMDYGSGSQSTAKAEQTACSFFISGYAYQTKIWHGVSAFGIGAIGKLIGSMNVYFGSYASDTSRPMVQIGSNSLTWSYPQVKIRDLQVGYNTGASVRNLLLSKDWTVGIYNNHILNYGTVSYTSVFKSSYYADSATNATNASLLKYTHTNEINFKGGTQSSCWFNYRNADTDAQSAINAITYKFANYSNDTSKTTIEAGTFSGNATSATNLKVSNHDTNNVNYYPIWANGKGDGSTARGIYTSTDLTYNPSTKTLKSTNFSGSLTGNCSGSAGSVAWSGVTDKPVYITASSVEAGSGVKAGKGYIKFSNGIMIHWGNNEYSKSISGGDNYDGPAITFSPAFTSMPSIVASSYGQQQFNIAICVQSESGFKPRYRNVNSSSSATTQGCYWYAIGKWN